MRAIAIKSFDSGPQLVDLPVPQPGPGEVLVRVRRSSLNGFDVFVASGQAQGMMEHRFPAVLGKDFAGTVEVVGDGVSTVVGDEVFGVLMRSYVGDGTFAEYVVVPESIGLAKIPAGLDVSIAGALGLAGTAAHDAIEAVAPSAGETVLIGGAPAAWAQQRSSSHALAARRASPPRDRERKRKSSRISVQPRRSTTPGTSAPKFASFVPTA